MSNTAISVKGLKKSFKDKEVLIGVDFEEIGRAHV